MANISAGLGGGAFSKPPLIPTAKVNAPALTPTQVSLGVPVADAPGLVPTEAVKASQENFLDVDTTPKLTSTAEVNATATARISAKPEVLATTERPNLKPSSKPALEATSSKVEIKASDLFTWMK